MTLHHSTYRTFPGEKPMTSFPPSPPQGGGEGSAHAVEGPGSSAAPLPGADKVQLTQGASSLLNRKICIDPGHGGRDPGAVGPTKYTEKEANLSIALELQKYLEEKGAKVVMTRKADLASGELSLEARVAMANSSRADLFISIHNNASANPQSRGTETYYDAHGSSASKVLSRLVLDRVAEKTGLPPRGSFPANFYVIKYTDMPGVLTESAFITNPAEEARLRDPAFRATLAEAIGEGMEAYFAKVQAEKIDTEKPHVPDDGWWDPLPCEKARDEAA